MKVLILAAGYGTRLRAIAQNTPKPLLPINEKPLVNYIMDKVENLKDLNEIILVTNNKFYTVFEDWAKALKDASFLHPITIVNDNTETPDERLGSIGDIAFVLNESQLDDDLLVVGGDNLFDYNLDEYIEFAKSRFNAVSMGLYNIENLEEAKLFGVVGLDEQGKLSSFEEKPEQPKSSLVAMCFYYLPRKTLHWVSDYLTEVKKSDTAGDYIRWLHQRHEVYGFEFRGTWYDIGSVEAYQEAQKKFTTN